MREALAAGNARGQSLTVEVSVMRNRDDFGGASISSAKSNATSPDLATSQEETRG